VFRSQVALGGVGLAVAGTAVVTAAGSVHRPARGTDQVVVVGQLFTYPEVNVAAAVLLVLAALGASVLVTIVRSAWAQRRAYRGFIQSLAVIGPLPGRAGVTVIEGAAPQAFCAGYLRPHVYVSRAALELLSEAELGAVLSHEDHHRATRDPLRFACGRVLSQALFFLPALRPLGEHYEELAEQRADAAAVRASAGARGPLAAALLAFDAAAPAGVAGISNERVDSLLGQAPGRRLPSPLIAVSLVLLGGFVIVVWRASTVASARATFDLPVLSSQPCLLVLALLPAVVVLAARGFSHSFRARG
jgi:Zn-dependent protease with chaperone function